MGSSPIEPSAESTEVQRVDTRVEPDVAPGERGIVPMWVELVVSSDPAETGPFPQPVTLPELTDGPHLSYAAEWFIFAAAVGVGWVLAVRKSINDRRTGSPPAGAASPREAVAPQPTSS